VVEVPRGLRHETDVLLRQLDGNLAGLRADRDPTDVMLAERITEVLGHLVTETIRASAADRAKVRAAVHYFVLRRDGRGERRVARALTEDVRVVNEILAALGRRDLRIQPVPEPAR
jgi:hypothetical protein